QFLSHFEQPLFRPYLGRGVIVKPRMPYCSKKNGICCHTYVMGGIGIGFPHGIYGGRPGQGRGPIDLVSKFFGNGIGYLNGLVYHFRANSIPCQKRYVQFHGFRLFGCLYYDLILCKGHTRLSIFSVAMMADTVWSESRPLVVSSRSLDCQVIKVSQRASELLPGGMRTA